MTDAGFLDALMADPGDATTRLVYSDWLEENGDDRRAGFLRLQKPIEPGVLAEAMEGVLGPLPMTITHLNAEEEAELVGRFAGLAKVEVLHAPHGSAAGEWMDLVLPPVEVAQAAPIRAHLTRLRGSG